MTKFINTNVFTQIDWDTEIVEPHVDANSDTRIERLSAFLKGWTVLNQQFKLEEVKGLPAHEKANRLRMLEYFYAKFLYHHELYYNRKEDVDVKEKIFSKENRRAGVPLPFEKMWELKLPKSNVPVEKLVQIGEIFLKLNEKERKEKTPKDGYYQEGKKLLEDAGLKVYEPEWKPKDRKHSDRNEYLTLHADGTVYFLYLLKGERTKKEVGEYVGQHFSMIATYHNHIIKPIYDELCKFPALGNIWAMNGGGGQCQVFFGNNKGYIGTLYLDGRSKKQKEVTGPRDYNFIVGGKRNDDILENATLPNCKVSLCRDHWKDHLDTIDYYKEEVES